MIDPEIFRSYDIRGIYPEQLNEKTAYLVGRAFVQFLKKKNKGKKSLNIVVGRDNRLSSNSLFRYLGKGILREKASLWSIGLSSTPQLYWTCSNFSFDGGVQITASHNPANYNGFKLVERKSNPIGIESGLKEIKKIVLANFEQKKSNFSKKIKKKNVLDSYLRFNLKLAGLDNKKNKEKLKKLKIIFDTANGVVGIEIKKLIKKIPLRAHHLFAKLDGSFPHHGPDPLIKENLKFLQREIKKRKAHLGVAFDGDGDRIVFLDEKGKVVPGDFITALISKIILQKKPGQKILYDIRSSNIVPEVIKKYKGVPVPSRIGHAFIKNKMHLEDIAFAGEFSGHYYLREHYFCEAPLFVLFKVLEELSDKQKPFSKIIKEFAIYQRTGEINFKVKKKKEILKVLEEKFKKGKISKLDGIRVDFPEWWFLARPSGTEDLLRLSLEAKTKKILLQKKKELVSIVKSFK